MGWRSGDNLLAIEKRCILQAMVRTNTNRKYAADILGITRRKLGYRIAKYGLEADIAAIQFQVDTGSATLPRQMAKVRGAPTPSSRVGVSPKSECGDDQVGDSTPTEQHAPDGSVGCPEFSAIVADLGAVLPEGFIALDRC